jgi:Ca2+-binding RTX toxin-like protein
MGNDANTLLHTVDGNAGDDVVVFDGTLGTTFDAIANGFRVFGGGDDSVTATAVETFEFDNGTVTFGASVTPERLSVSALEQAAGSAWVIDNVLEYNGTAVANAAGTWSLETANGSALAVGNTVTVLDGTTVQGTLTYVASAPDTVVFTADSAYQSSLNVGETANASFEVVLSDGAGGTFTETFTAVVTGAASAGADTLIGTEEADTANLLAGDDYAVGNDGADSILGGDGNDTIYAGATDTGADTLVGGDDDDVLAGGAGDDALIGNGATTAGFIAGTAGTDDGTNQVYGGAGNDAIAIGGFNDGAATFTTAGLIVNTAVANAAAAFGTEGGEAFGGAGDDYIVGTASGHDLVGMGDGDDTVVLGSGNDTVYAGADDTGADDVFADAGDNTVFTGAGADSITATTGDNEIGAGSGDDTISLGGGDNTVFGGEGDDAITTTGGAGDIFGGAGNDTINTGAGNDMIFGGSGDDAITTGAGDDTVDSGTGDDTTTLTGAAGTDVIIFTAGNDTIVNFDTTVDKIDVSALGITNFDDAIIVSSTTSTTITFDDDTSITYDDPYALADFIF